MWQCCIISELRTVWQISNPISKELEARDFSRVSVHYSYASSFTLQTNLSKDKNALYKEIRESILERMVYLKIKAKDATNKEIRIMEERQNDKQ